MDSKTGEMSTTDWKKWRRDLLRFTIPPLSLYIGSVLFLIQVPGHIVALADFIPSNLVLGGCIVYLGSQLQNLLTKYLANNP